MHAARDVPRVIPDPARRFLEATRFASIATVNEDGSPHQAVVWYRLHPDGVVVNSLEGRIWPTNLLRDARTSLLVEDAYRWVVIRARAERFGDAASAQADIAEMARRYHADDPAHAELLIERRFRQQRRISFLLRPVSVSEDLSG